MKWKLFIGFFLITTFAFGQKISFLSESSFQVGEKLNYKFRYGIFTGAEATLQVLATDKKFDNKEALHLEAKGKTSGTFDLFFKVRNHYDSYINKETYLPFLYQENIRESDYKRTDQVTFNRNKNTISAKSGNYKMAFNQVFDLVSSYYFARNFNLDKIENGDKITLHYFLEDGIYPLTIIYLGKEKIKTNFGYINCRKFSPSIEPGRIFRKDSDFFLWITDDTNNIPVKAFAELVVGSITMELTNAQGLKKPLQIVSRK